MAINNSSISSNKDNNDKLIMSHSICSDNSITTNNQAYSKNGHNYVSDDDDPLEATKQIEQILESYRKELKQESNTQLDCNQQLIKRLFDFIRPAYSSYKKKKNELDALFEEISTLQDIRYIQEKEKTEQLQSEILHLKKLISTSVNEGHSSNDTMTKVYRIDSMVNYEQWMTLEEETKELHNLVELQRDRINELIKLIPQEETSSLQASASINIAAPLDEASIGKQQSTVPNANTEHSPVTTDRSHSNQQQDSGMDTLQRSINEFPSLDIENNETQNEEPPTVITRPLPLLARISSYYDIKRCPICDHEFVSTANEFEIIKHVDACFASAGIDDPDVPIQPKQYKCPNCIRQFPGHEEKAYLQHLAACFAEDGYHLNRSVPSVKQNVFLESIRTCPLCQAIFNILSMDEQQFEEHIKAHSYQKRR